jgi:hypothetical protein
MRHLIVFGILIYSSIILAQPIRVKVNPASIIFSTINVQAEVATFKKQSVQVGIMYFNLSLRKNNIDGIGITPEYRFYKDSTNTRLFFGPFFRYMNYVETFNKRGDSGYGSSNIERLGAGLMVGKVYTIKKNILFEISGGPEIHFIKYATRPGATQEYLDEAADFPKVKNAMRLACSFIANF